MDQIIERFKKLDTTCVSDAMDKIGIDAAFTASSRFRAEKKSAVGLSLFTMPPAALSRARSVTSWMTSSRGRSSSLTTRVATIAPSGVTSWQRPPRNTALPVRSLMGSAAISRRFLSAGTLYSLKAIICVPVRTAYMLMQ